MNDLMSENEEQDNGKSADVQNFLNACSLGQVDLCLSYLRRGVPVNAVDCQSRTGMMIAAGCDNLEVVKLLMNHGGDPTQPDDWGYNAILTAAASKEKEIFQILSNKCKIHTFMTFLGRLTTLTEAAMFGRNDIIELCLQYDEELVNVPVELTGMTPLMLAIVGRHHSTVELLLKNKADTNARNSSSHNALGIAVQMMDEHIVELLYEYSRPSDIPRIVVTSPGSPDRNREDRENLMKIKAVTPTSRVPLKREEFQRVNLSKKRRSKSCDSGLRRHQSKFERSEAIFRFILQTEGLERFWKLFEEQEVDLKLFLNLKKSDFYSIGIMEEHWLERLMETLDYYRPVLND